MKKQNALKVINLLMITDVIVIVFALVFYKAIPSALQGSEAMAEIHEISGAIFIILAIIHFILNFNWIKSMYFKKK
jgi:hypothetical protein